MFLVAIPFFSNILFVALFFLGSNMAEAQGEQASPPINTITINLAHPTKVDDVAMAFGAGIDGHPAGEAQKMLSPDNVKAMLSAGLKPLSYRLRTELGMEAWHWNEAGSWSDPSQHQGYWTSASHSKKPLLHGYGYRLPRRGNTLDEANNDGYSRIDDGNPSTFWKSNPYLTSHYTGEPDEEHPQWVALDLEKSFFINAIRIHWGEPYARKFRVQFATTGALYFGHEQAWHDFPHVKIIDGQGGSKFLELGQPTSWGRPLPIRFVRIWMTESSGTAPNSSQDPRDKMGYAIREIEAGEIKPDKNFHDHVVHRPDTHQTLIYTSSTDPWHRACDRDEKTEQPGFDFIMQSGLTNKLPPLWAIPILYDTPENAAAAASYIAHKTNQPLRFELGEEPDGQRVDPKDVATLYRQVAKKIHAAVPSACLGGLSFVTIDVEPDDTTYRFDHRPWLRRFFQQLKKFHQEKDFRFLSFEWYPFDDVLLPTAPLLLRQPARLQKAVARLRHGALPRSMPLIISEYGYSVFAGEPEVKVAAALLNADIAAQFLLLGGATSYLYGYEPNELECVFGNSWGNLTMFLQNEKGGIRAPLPTYFAAQLVTQRWGMAGPCEVYPATSSCRSKEREPFVTAYFLKQKAGGCSLLVINKNPNQEYRIKCCFQHPGKKERMPFPDCWDCYSYSPTQYQWHANGSHGFPTRSAAPSQQTVTSNEYATDFVIAPWSITVLRKKSPDH